MKTDECFLVSVRQTHREGTVLYMLGAFLYSLWASDVKMGYHGDETFLCVVQPCGFVCKDLCALRPYTSFSAWRIVVTQILLICLAFMLIYWHTVSSSWSSSNYCHLCLLMTNATSLFFMQYIYHLFILWERPHFLNLNVECSFLISYGMDVRVFNMNVLSPLHVFSRWNNLWWYLNKFISVIF